MMRLYCYSFVEKLEPLCPEFAPLSMVVTAETELGLTTIMTRFPSLSLALTGNDSGIRRMSEKPACESD
jgi:hypothetical protein